MSKPLLIYVISERQFKHYTSWIKQPFECTSNFDEADIILFAGGEDISPSIYGESPHKLTYTNPLRDDTEAFLFNKAQEMGKMCLGICRGLSN